MVLGHVIFNGLITRSSRTTSILSGTKPKGKFRQDDVTFKEIVIIRVYVFSYSRVVLSSIHRKVRSPLLLIFLSLYGSRIDNVFVFFGRVDSAVTFPSRTWPKGRESYVGCQKVPREVPRVGEKSQSEGSNKTKHTKIREDFAGGRWRLDERPTGLKEGSMVENKSGDEINVSTCLELPRRGLVKKGIREQNQSTPTILFYGSTEFVVWRLAWPPLGSRPMVVPTYEPLPRQRPNV